MIIIEGFDNTGKSSLAKSLSEVLPIRVVHSGGPPGHLGLALNKINEILLEDNPATVYDRILPISERVYGPVLRGKDIFGDYTFNILDLVFKKQPLLIYCRPPISQIKKWKDRDQMTGVIARADQLICRYDFIIELVDTMRCGRGSFLQYDYTRDDYAMVFHRVRDYLKSRGVPVPSTEKTKSKSLEGEEVNG